MKILLFLISMSMVSYSVQADELTDALNNHCEKTKQCASENTEGSPTSMKDMMKHVMASMCDGLDKPYQAGMEERKLYKPALACISSRNKLPCDSLEANTPACDAYEKLLEAYDNN